MKEQVTWLKDALDTKKLVEHLAYYYLHEGRLYATTGKMTASIPFPYFEGTLLLSGKEFEQVIKAAPKDAVLEVTDGGRARVRAGRFRAYIPVLDPEKWPLEREFTSYDALPAGFLDLATKLRDFISENATKMWSACLAVTPEGMYATNNFVVAFGPLDTGLTDERQLLLPEWAVDFLLGRKDGLEEWGWDDGAAYFSWTNGGKMKTQLVNEEYPTKPIQSMIKKAEPTVTIEGEWRTALLRLTTLAGSQDITLFKDTASFGSEGELFVEDGLETPAPEGGLSCWVAEQLNLVMKVAEKWNPTVWPSPAPFEGQGLRGVVASKRPK